MNSCAHIAWLQAIENEATGQLSLEETGRLSRIVQNMPHANVQTPRLGVEASGAMSICEWKLILLQQTRL
ncbi:hypothetical protein Egran_04405 [Elaphomyces granulatus]|uniref:Uncharacterized protein n=1 Tax=Elaphomyces granulatus TaxID=519963 RepID=A0A232LUI2_9EURO|nr:hypothetical protein Egran_04405 [Elaphomyces granulatus]